MAQVRKLQSGGAISKMYINNEPVDVNEDFIRQLKSTFNGDDEALKAFLNPNETFSIYYDPFTNTTTGNVPVSNNERKNKKDRIENDRRNKLAALLYNRPGKFVEGMDYLSPGDKLEIYFDEQGNMKSDARFDARMNALFNENTYQNMEGVRDFATLKTINGAKDFYLSEDAKKAWEEFNANRTKSNFDKFKSYFNEANIYYAEEPKTEEQLAAEAKAKAEADKEKARKALTEKGWDANIYGDRFVVNDKGQVQLIDADLTNALSQYTGKNLWLNEDFKNAGMKNGYDFSWIPTDKGLFRINGNWYLGNNMTMTGNDLVAFNNWVSHNKTTPGGSNEYFVQYWNTKNPYERDIQDDNMYSYAINPGDYYIDKSGIYVRGDNTPLVYDIFDQSLIGGDVYDDLGHIKNEYLKRVYVDPDSGEILKNYDPNNLQLETNMDAVNNYYSDNNKNRKTAFRQYMTANDGAIKYRPVSAFSNNNTGYGLFYTPKSDNYYWHSQNFLGDDAPLNYAFKDVSNSGIIVDPRVAQWIQNNSDLIKMDPQLAYEIDKIVRMPWLTPGNWRDEPNLDTSIFDKYPSLAELVKNLEATPYMMGEEEWNYHHNPKNSGLSNVANENGYIIRFDKKKNGGILKHQFGGVTWNPSTKATEGKKEKIAAPARGAGEAKVIGDGTNLNTTDLIEIGALITDVASLGLSFVPGANIGAAAVGAGASIADFAANVKKDGLDWSDAGRLGLNLLLDAGTLLPGVGGVSKAAKVAKVLTSSKAVAKAIKIASVTGSVAGIGNVALSWDRLKDGKWTIDDIRTVLNGLRGVTNFTKMKGSPTKAGKQSDTITLKADGKDPITITKAQYDKIKDLPTSEQKIKMAEIVRKQMPKSSVDDIENKVLTENEKESSKTIDIKEAEEILSKYNISFKKSKSDFSLKNPESWAFWRTGKIGDLDFPSGNRMYYDPTSMPWYHWRRRAAIRDARVNRDNPYFNKMAISDKRIIKNTINDTPITGYIRGKNTPVINTNLMPVFIEEGPKPQSNAFLYKNGGIIKAKNGWLSNFADKIKSGEQSLKPIIDTARMINNINTTNKYYDQKDKMAKEIANVRREVPQLRTNSINSYIAPAQQQMNSVERAYSNLKASIPKTNDAIKNFSMLNEATSQELAAKKPVNALFSNGVSKHNIDSTNTYNKQAAINAEAATQKSLDLVKSNVASYESKDERAATIGNIFDAAATQASRDAAMRDANALKNKQMTESNRLRNLYSTEEGKLYERAKLDYDAYSKQHELAGKEILPWEEWFKNNGYYNTRLSEMYARYMAAENMNRTIMRDPYTGGLTGGLYYNPQWVNYNSYGQNTTHVAGAKNGRKLTAQDRINIDNNKSTSDIQKEKIKNALQSIKESNKRIYDILNNLL